MIFSLPRVNAQCCLPDNAPLKQLIESSVLRSTHVGVYVYDDSSKKVIADYQSDKYFVPASNVKLFSLYAGMKYLGDSLCGISYYEKGDTLFIIPTGDPGFLHPDFQSQPVFDFLKKTKKKIYVLDRGFPETPMGPGWSWDDYNDDYSVERSQFPVYGNFIRWNQQKSLTRSNASFEPTATITSSPEIPWKVRFSTEHLPETFLVKRLIDSNVFVIRPGDESDKTQDVPFITNNLNAAVELLRDTLDRDIYIYQPAANNRTAGMNKPDSSFLFSMPVIFIPPCIYSRPVDSVYIPMMYRSDNFFAEQILLMAGRQKLGIMKAETMIDTLLNGPLADLPQKPNWVDGSGLSRYNLFTPQDFVSLLIRFKNEFGMDRMKTILPTGGKGTLKNHYQSDSGRIFMKTGSMTGVLCLSGYLYTDKKHLLEFSILVNNNNGGGSAIRREVEKYIAYLLKNN